MDRTAVTILESHYGALKQFVLMLDPDAFCDMTETGTGSSQAPIVYVEIVSIAPEINSELLDLWAMVCNALP